MSLPEKTEALLAAMSRDDLDALPPASRRRFADLLAHWHSVAATPPPCKPTAGVLALLTRGDRAS
jgi:hypothetical protein